MEQDETFSPGSCYEAFFVLNWSAQTVQKGLHGPNWSERSITKIWYEQKKAITIFISKKERWLKAAFPCDFYHFGRILKNVGTFPPRLAGGGKKSLHCKRSLKQERGSQIHHSSRVVCSIILSPRNLQKFLEGSCFSLHIYPQPRSGV